MPRIDTRDTAYYSRNACLLNCQIRIKLPGVKYSDVQLDVTDSFLDCRTPLQWVFVGIFVSGDDDNLFVCWAVNLGCPCRIQLTARMGKQSGVKRRTC